MCRDNQLEEALLEYIELYGLTAKAHALFCKESFERKVHPTVGKGGDQHCRDDDVKREP